MAALAFHGARKTRRHGVRRRITDTQRSNASPINRAGGGTKAPPCWHPCAYYSSPSPVASLDRRQPVHGLTPRVLAAAHLATGVAQTGDRARGMRLPTQALPISVTEAPSARLSMPISIARFVLAGDRCAPDAAAASARLGLGLDCEAARIVASPSVDRALLSTIASGSVAAAAEAPGCAAAASARPRAEHRAG
jgi:hypothetical protein